MTAGSSVSSPVYLLDNNVVSYFFNAGAEADLVRVAKAVPLVVVREVHEEAARHPTRGKQYEKWQPSSGLEVRDIVVGGEASTCLASLQTASGSLKDLGELASIALALEDRGLVVVSNDKIRLSTFLRRAHAAAGLTKSTATKLAKHSQLVAGLPTWWTDWLRTLPAR